MYFEAFADVTARRKITASEGTVSELIDFFPNDAFKKRIVIRMGPVTLKIGTRAKMTVTSSGENSMRTGFTGSVVAGPVLKHTNKKGFHFEFFDKRGPSDEPGGADGKCTGAEDDDNPCFQVDVPYLENEGSMTVRPAIEPEIFVTSPVVLGAAGATIGLDIFTKFSIEKEVDATYVDSVTASNHFSDIVTEEVSCPKLTMGFAPTLGLELVGNEILEWNISSWEFPLWGECYEETNYQVADGCELDATVSTVCDLDDPVSDHLCEANQKWYDQGLCTTSSHCTRMEKGSDSRPDVQCMLDQPECDTDVCICQEPDPTRAPDFVSSARIRGAWLNDPEQYCCLPQEAIRERKEYEAEHEDDGNHKGVVYWNSFSCNDGDPSTVDTCSNNRCIYEYLPGSCLEDSDCDPNEVWTSEDADRDLGELSFSETLVQVQPTCHQTYPFAGVDQDLIEKKFGVRSYIDLTEEQTAILTRNVQSPLFDDRGKLGQKDGLGVCSWNFNAMPDAVPTRPVTDTLDCNVNSQFTDCDDGLPFTFDYCAVDPEVLEYNWSSPEDAPAKWGRCYHGIRECPVRIMGKLGDQPLSVMKPCCEARVGKKLKSDMAWLVRMVVGDVGPDEYDWVCAQIKPGVRDASVDGWKPGDE